TFDATDKINVVRWLPGRPYLQYDQTFLIFHRNPDATGDPNFRNRETKIKPAKAPGPSGE
ncbi:MAG: hypothetical protein ABSF60_07115, partial [Verrucomicrobiota bacterium]